MPSYPEYQQQFVGALVASSSARVGDTAGGMSPGLQALVDALPYYQDLECSDAHRNALVNLLEVNLPNNGIAPHPKEKGSMGYSTSYTYRGPYSGYRDAFYHAVAPAADAAAIASLVQGVNGDLNAGWWGNYGVAILTDAIRVALSFSVDTGKLAADLQSYNQSFLPALSASYLGTFETGFAPTAAAYAAIVGAGQTAQACSELTLAIGGGQFTANINQAIAMGGDSTNAAVWFLYNLWIALKALGAADVDADIQQFQTAGLTVPSEIGPTSWWNGGYSSWYAVLSGADVTPAARDTMTASMPEGESSMTPDGNVSSKTSAKNGYSNSLCSWGSLAWYKPPSHHHSSCFGAATGVLMADGSVKAIEQVRLGDQVRSHLGPRKVVLIESPRRRGRTLYRLDGQAVLATAAHPFRAADGAGPRRRAIDAWDLVDAIPPMAAHGAGTLTAGAALAGLVAGEARTVTVEAVAPVEAGPGDGERVYDLVLESWERGHPTYYVGGPERFFAVEAETSDPLFDVPTTLGVVAAMETALPSCRRRVTDPAAELPPLLAQLPAHELADAARRAEWTDASEKPERPSLPGPEFYMQGGAWDPHAALLEAHLVRQFGIYLLREAATGWRAEAKPPASGDLFSVLVHDLSLVGEAPIEAGARVDVRLRVRGWGGDEAGSLAVASRAKRTGFLAAHATVELCPVPAAAGPAVLVGIIERDGALYGRFGAAISYESLRGARAEHFIFGPRGHVVGRIALEQRSVSPADLAAEKERAGQWSSRRASVLGTALGHQIGRALATLLEPR